MKNLCVAIVQTNAGTDIESNLSRAIQLVARIRNVDIIAFPEVFTMRGSDQDYRRTAEPLTGRVVSEISRLAAKKRTWILAGSVIEKSGSHVYNTSILFDRAGKIKATYRKIHLFEAHLDDNRHIREADAYSAGNKPVLVDIEGWRAGLAICYDIRFPELFRHYAKHGSHLLFAPSNFTQRTGKDHWEILLRARAIENQCFVVAPDQCGRNSVTSVASHGHSMAVGPWGEILCKAGTSEKILIANLDPSLLQAIRKRIPALKHRVL